MKEIGIGMGALSGPITKQLSEQGYAFANERVGQRYDRLKHSLLSLVFAGVVTDSQRSKMEQKLIKKIFAEEIVMLDEPCCEDDGSCIPPHVIEGCRDD